MKYRYLLALTLSALLLAGCTKPAPNTSNVETEASATETTVATAETTTAVTYVTEETAVTTAETAPEKLAEKDIGGGYTIYATEKNDEYTLHLADENGETDSMSITYSQFRGLKPSSHEYHPELNFYDFEVPPYFSLDAGGSLQYRTYFAVDGKIREAEWYLDGEKLESIDYTMLYCRGDSDKVVSYSVSDYDFENNRYGELTKRTFTFDKENLRFDGYSEPAPAPDGAAAIASEMLYRSDIFWGELYNAEFDPDVYVDNYCMITEEGFRTKDEIIGTLLEFCMPSAAEEIYNYFFESKYMDFMEIDGRMYLFVGAPSMYRSTKYVESAVEADGRIIAKIYSYTLGQDVPHHIDPPLYAEFVQENGIWKIASMPSETTAQEQPDPEADIVMKPIPSGEQFEVMACEITELPIIKTEEDFPDKEALKLAKELCFNNNTKEIASYNEGIENEDGLPIETAKDIRFSNGVSYDFDNDGKDESVICLHYTPDFYLGGGYCVYVDDEKYEILMSGGGCHIEVSVLEFDSYRFMQLNTYAGAIGYYYDIYSFESGMPEKALDIGDSHAIDYENGFFTCYIKYQFTAFPFAFCSDGKFRQFAIEKITPEDFEAHVTDGKAYLDTLDNLEAIYTSGYYAYWFMCGDEERYLSLNGNGVYEESRAYGYIDTQFTNELIYGKDVWSAAPISTPDPAEKIWNFLSTYESKYTTDLYFLFDFNGDDFPEVAFVGWDMDTPYMNVFDLSGSEPAFLGGTVQGLSPYSDDEECIGLYRNDKGEYFYHSLEHYVMPNYKLNGSSFDYYCFNRHIIPVDFDSHTVEFSFEGTDWKGFDNEADAEKYKERVFKELEQLTLVTELKTSYMAEDRDDEEAFRAMLAELTEIN